MAGGRAGADRAIDILCEQVVRTMKLLGVRSVGELTPAHVTRLSRLPARTITMETRRFRRPLKRLDAARTP